MEFLYVLAAFIIGAIISWLALRVRHAKEIMNVTENFTGQERQKDMLLNDMDKAKSIAEDRYNKALEEIQKLESDLRTERENAALFQAKIAGLDTENKNVREKLENQKTEIENIQKKLTLEFENIANRLLKINSQEFTDMNSKNIGDILKPLKEKITDFEKKVNEAYDVELRDKISLREEVRKLFDLNKKISEEANNLTKALKGDSKKQGNWGEVVLERILERSGLTKGSEYETQVSTINEEGRRIQPDVVVYLPDKKHVIIDSKVSLVAYENYVNATTEEHRHQYLKEHILSIRNHIKELSDKGYQLAAGFNSPDFVLMFIPVESSFGIAVQSDQQIFNDAWDNRIVIVSPSTLLATLKTVSSIWKQENQTKNAIEIAKQSGALYDKFVGFVMDLKKIGDNITRTQGSYHDALNKISTGTGNLISRAENIRKLGAKATKHLPEEFVSDSEAFFLEEK